MLRRCYLVANDGLRLQAGKTMEAVVRKNGEKLGDRMILTAAEKTAVSIVHGYLEPFYKTTNNMCTTKMPTIGLILFFMDRSKLNSYQIELLILP